MRRALRLLRSTGRRSLTPLSGICVVITGAGRGFCAGADVAYLAELMERQDVDEFTRLLNAGRRVLTTFREMTKPVIASINGPAYGAGFNLALCCDLRIAAESASFSQSFVKVG